MARGEIPITDRTFRKFSNERSVENELKEILIIRDDGSRILIQEIISDLEKLKKIRIVELDENDKAKKKYHAYTEGLDFDYMDGETRYADVVGENLLSKERLNRKENEAKQYGLNDIYVGHISFDLKGECSVYSLDYKNILPIIAKEKRKKAQNKECTQKNNLLDRIVKRLKDADVNQLKEVLSVLERLQSRGEHGD